jgi:hypothetical protein
MLARLGRLGASGRVRGLARRSCGPDVAYPSSLNHVEMAIIINLPVGAASGRRRRCGVGVATQPWAVLRDDKSFRPNRPWLVNPT